MRTGGHGNRARLGRVTRCPTNALDSIGVSLVVIINHRPKTLPETRPRFGVSVSPVAVDECHLPAA